MTDTIVSNKTKRCRSLNVTVVSNSVHTYLNYSKKMQLRLAEINNNVSSVIKESCLGIDNICNRVRQCLSEMEQSKKTFSTNEITEHKTGEEKSRNNVEISQDIDETVEDISVIEEQKFSLLQSPESLLSLDESNCDKQDLKSRESCQVNVVENEQLLRIEQPPESLLSLNEISYDNREVQHKEQLLHIEQPPESLLSFNEISYDDREVQQKEMSDKKIYSLLDENDSPRELQSDSESTISLDQFKEKITSLCDNFDIMNRLVENISKKITKLSETTIPNEKASQQSVQKRKLNTSTHESKITKDLRKQGAIKHNIELEDYFSEIDIGLIQPGDRDSNILIIPDVYRKRAFTNLYQKLVAQVEANDSLMLFQNLMNRQKKLRKKNENATSQIKLNSPVIKCSIPKKSTSNSSNQVQPPRKINLAKKYADSLWFSPKHVLKERSNFKHASRNDCRNKKVKNKNLEKKGSQNKTPTSESNKCSAQSKKLPKFNSVENLNKRTCSLDCTCRMVVENNCPVSPSTKCHLQWLKAKPAQRKLKFLDILDDLTNRDLLPLQSEYPRRDNQQARELDYKSIQDTYLYKIMYGKECSKNVWKQLLEPTYTPNQNLPKTSRPVNPKKSIEKTSRSTPNTHQDKFSTQNYSKADVLKTLMPYMYDPEKRDENYSQSVIVMPVRVYHDNFKTNEPPIKLANPSKPSLSAMKKVSASPSKEIKFLKKGEWSPPKISKPMKVVYDSLPKKSDILSTSGLNKPFLMSPKPLISSARLSVEKNPMKRVTSRSFSPKGFTPYCQDSKNVKEELLDLRQQQNIAIYSKIHEDIEKIKKEIYGKKTNQMDRKLWKYKYGKSVGQKLITYIQQQQPMLESPLPAHARPKLQRNVPEKNVNFLKNISPHRQVLQHIQGLKIKNEEIQSNIKKAIEVIETRMVDVLCDDSKSVEAFSIMEKEITNVLSLMKCKAKTNLKPISSKSSDSKEESPRFELTTIDDNIEIIDEMVFTSDKEMEENYDIISDHLFERLERILDTGGSSISNTSIQRNVTVKLQGEKDRSETGKKRKFSSWRRNEIDIGSTSTSASTDEQINTRHSHRISSKLEKSESKSKLSATTPLTLESITKDLWENICGDRNIDTNIPVNESSDGQIDREVVKYDKIVSSDTCEEAWLNSEGDFVKQEDIAQNVKLLDNVEAVMTITDVICEDKVEKLITEEKPNALTENMEECDNFDVEEFIKDKLNKITDSIMVLSEETSIGQLQNKPIISTDNVEKENIESSNYKTSRSKPSDVDKNMPPATKVINSIAVLDEATNQEQLQNESIINIGQKEKPESNSDNQHEFLEIDIEIPVPNHVIDSIIVLDEEANPTQSQNKKKLELSSPNGRQSEPLNVDKRTQVRYKVIDSTQADNETNLEQAQNELKIEKDMFISCNYNNQELEHTDLCRIEVRNKKNEPITLQDEDTNLEQMQNEPIEKEKQFEPSDINKQVQVINRDDSEYTEHFEKILKRVEDVYFQLDEIQESESVDRIPVFKDAEISEIPSDIFLTPFMQAVKETRKNVKESNNVAVIDKSPSYYNVMNFLDTLTNIQKETPYEVHIAHLHHYTHVYRQTTIYRQTEIWHEAQYSSSSSLKSSCLRKSSEESRGKHKKVSFYQMGKEDKSNQVTLCPFHKIKAVRISSQQFPPQSSDEEVYDKICVSNRGDYIKETRSKVDQNENIASKQVLVCKSSNNSETSRKCSSFKNIYCAKKQQDSVIDNKHKHKHVPCKIHGQLNKTSEISNFEIGKISKSEDSSEVTRKCEMSVIGDKSTQVFCQMQTEENSVVHSVTEDNAYHTSNDEPSLDYPECIEENPDDSKSTEKDFLDNSLMDPFYDYTSENVTPKGVIQKIEGIYEEDNVKLVKNSVETQPKIVVFREVLEVPSPLPPLKSINNLNDIEQYKKRLEKRKEVRLMKKSSAETVMEKISKTRCDDDNVVILKSFYAIIYILMFAALSLDYRCL